MATVVMHNVVSVDGFIADDNDDPGPLFEWYSNGDTRLVPGQMDDPTPGGMKISKTSFQYVRPTWDSIKAMVIGRHLFDITNGWEGKPPTGEHVIVVSHRAKPDDWHPEASYEFISDVSEAVARARELADDGVVAVAAGDVGGQALAAGLVDEVASATSAGSTRSSCWRTRTSSSRGTGSCTCATGYVTRSASSSVPRPLRPTSDHALTKVMTCTDDSDVLLGLLVTALSLWMSE